MKRRRYEETETGRGCNTEDLRLAAMAEWAGNCVIEYYVIVSYVDYCCIVYHGRLTRYMDSAGPRTC